MHDDECDCCMDICDFCNRCLDHECECTNTDREVHYLKQRVEELETLALDNNKATKLWVRELMDRVSILEKTSCKCSSCAIMEKGEFV